MSNNKLFILSGKYEVLRTLGTGSFSTVYLARHQSLEVERAIKVIPKPDTDHSFVLSEARLLKSMNHPGIPMIYDIEEDSDSYYLVEEFIVGESLDEFLLHQKFISQSFYLTCCIQLCDIFIYLHSFLPHPVLYQDLKPAHIIVCGNQIKLIDFGVSSSITSLGNNFKQFGNRTFSAPEHLSGKEESVTADVFSIGKMMDYLAAYVKEPLSKSFRHIIQKATDPDPTHRYETVDELLLEIQQFYLKISQPHLCKKIAVVGSFPGCGTTHISISLVSTLNFMGFSAIYFEKNNSNALNLTFQALKGMKQENGCIMYRSFIGLPNYGPGVTIPIPSASISVYDYGTDLSSALLADVDDLLLICTPSPWHMSKTLSYKKQLLNAKDQVKIICNLSDRQIARFFAREFSLPVYLFTYEKDPFLITEGSLQFTKQLFHQKGRFLLFSIIKGILQNIRHR